jgi:hypothetical protein
MLQASSIFFHGAFRVPGATSVLLPPHGVIIFPLRLTAGSGKISSTRPVELPPLAADGSELPRNFLLVTCNRGDKAGRDDECHHSSLYMDLFTHRRACGSRLMFDVRLSLTMNYSFTS